MGKEKYIELADYTKNSLRYSKAIELLDYAKNASYFSIGGAMVGIGIYFLNGDPTYIGRFAGYGVGMGLAYTHGIKNGRGK